MIHAWVVPDFDNDIGVFAMWNQSISPVTDSESIEDSRLVRGTDFPDGAEQSLITDFRFDDDLRVKAGQALFFNNVDAVPHTVTAGSPDGADDDFDSGVLTPGSNFSVTFDAPGVYSLFCALHPDMRGTVEVID